MSLNVSLSWADFLVIAICLTISAGIGVLFRFAGGRQSSTEEFLMGNRQMSVFPVALSLLSSFISAITIMGTPPEIYLHGTQYMVLGISNFLVIPVTAYVYMPVLYDLRLTSAYEYLSLRFDESTAVRTAASVIFIFWMIIYMSVVLYSPCLALSAVTGLNLWTLIVVTGLVCIFYTSLGGMKAVMWTDAFQVTIMYSALVAYLALGSANEGGWASVWAAAKERGRVEFFNVDPSPFERHTIWSLLIGGSIMWLVIYAINQSQVQRCLASPTKRAAQVALWVNAPGLALFLLLSAMCGFLILARYRDCDPLSAGMIDKADQLAPLYIMDVFSSSFPGLAGLFIACVCSASLSTISSGLNALAAVFLQDVVKAFCSPNITDARAASLSKVICILFGVVVIGLTWVASKTGSILTAALALHGAIGGPLLGVFTLGMFVPAANSKGALAGMLSGVGVTMWIIVGAQIYPPPEAAHSRCVSTSRCDQFQHLFVNASEALAVIPVVDDCRVDAAAPSVPSNASASYEGLSLYRISYIWYSLVAVVIVVVVGVVVSVVSGANDANRIDARFISPIYHFCCEKLPPRWRKKFACKKTGEEKGEEKGEREEEEEKNGREEEGFGQVANSKL